MQLLPFNDMRDCIRLTNGLDGTIWIISDTIALKTPIEYDVSFCQLPDSASSEWLQQSQESRESIEWEKNIFAYLNNKGASHLIRSYFHADEGIFMEYIPGGNLHECIKTATSMEFSRKFYLLYQLVAIVAELAELGLAHGDLRPENFLLDSFDYIKCCDFAATVRLGEPYRRIPWPLYIRPASRDILVADEPGQAFSIALPIYFIITGHRPYHTKPLHEAVNLFREGIFPATDGGDFKIYYPVGEIIRKCWHGEYPKVSALKLDVENAGRALGIQRHVDPSATSPLMGENDLRCRRNDCESFLRGKRLAEAEFDQERTDPGIIVSGSRGM